MAVIKRVRLSEIAELVTKGTTPTTLGYEFQDTGVNFLKIECFSEKGDYIQNKATHISEECHEKLKRSQLKEGDILFSIAGVIGRVAIVTRNMLPANINQALAIIRTKKDDIYLPYVKLILTSPLIKKQFERKKQGVAQLNISLKDINDLEIPLPEIGKQIEYANSFKKVEKLIYTRQYQLQKLDELVKARFVELFGDCKSMVSMNELCSIITDGTHQPPRFQESGIPFIFVSNLVGNVVTYNAEKFISEDTYAELYKRTPIEIGDLLLSTVGSYGHPAVVTEDRKFLFQRHIAYLKPRHNMVNSFYLHSALLAPDGQRQIEEKVKGIAQKALNLSEIKKIVVPLPTIEEQNSLLETNSIKQVYARAIDPYIIKVERELQTQLKSLSMKAITM